MAKKDARFHVETVKNDSFGSSSQIWVDKKTGVNYLFVASGYAAGLSPLLDRDGKPVISALPLAEE